MALSDAVPGRTGDPRDGSSAQDGFDAMNDEINALVAAQGDRSVIDLVPEVEAVMHRHGVTPPSREGVLQWIDGAIAAAEARRGAAS